MHARYRSAKTNRSYRKLRTRPLRVELLEDRRMLAAAITVNSTSDLDARDALLSLREAILVNNRTLAVSALTAAEQAQIVGSPTASDTDTIAFNIPGAGPHTISPASALPNITDPVLLDGYTQPGASANTGAPDQALNTQLMIELAGNLVPASPGLRLATGSGGSTIRGLAINRFANNLWIDTHGNTIAGNFVGTNIAGTVAMPGSANGILLISAANNSIGGTNPSDSNLISGNATNGITIVETGANNNVIRGNRIGTDITGNVDLGNVIFGVYLYRAPGTIIGGNTTAARNLISGNNNSGIWMDENCHDSIIQGNLIGTNLAGDQEIGNSNNGIQTNFTSRTIIGGLDTGEGNIIAGSGGNAINIQNAVAPVIKGNQIGTDASGTLDLGNLGGIFFNAVRDSTIESNTIAFNNAGIQISGNTFGDPETGNLISRNSIYANTSSVAIDLFGTTGVVNGPDFPQDATDSDTGANDLQNFPIITSVTDLGGMTRVEGTLTTLLNSTFRLEFFASATPTSSGFGPGQTFLGDLDVVTAGGSNTVNFTVDLPAVPAGQSLVTATATDITNPGSGPRNNTSEFSPAVAIDTAYRVTTTSDTAGETLRQALTAANFTPGVNTITFAIPPNDPNHFYYQDDGIAGQVSQANIATTTAADDASIANIDPDWSHSWYSIELGSQLVITDEVIIDGYSQPGAVANSNAVGAGLNSVLTIEINGENATGISQLDGLIHVDASNSTLRGLVINRAGVLATSGMHVQLRSGTNNKIEGNYIGTDVSGSYSYPLGSNGYEPVYAAVGVNDNPAVPISGNTVGGTTPAARNLLSGTSAGVAFFESAPNNVVEGNLIGTDRSGTKVVANRNGVWVESVGIVVGGAAPGAGNVISGNETAVELSDFLSNSHHNILQNNWIGTDAAGSGALGNLQGVVVVADNNQIRGNTIAFNQGPGVVIGGGGNLISQNSIHTNVTLGIELSSDGLTLNDVPPQSSPPDQDTGGNNLQNFPTLTSVTSSGGATQVQGSLTSTPNSTFRIEFFANRERDEGIYIFDNDDIVPGMFGEGQTYIGFVDVVTDSSGVADFDASLPALPINQDFVSATATDITDTGSGPRNDTSEFSALAAVGGLSTVVVDAGDVGVGTLREAIFVAQLTSASDIVTFNIPASDPRHVYYRDDGISGQINHSMIATTTATDDGSIGDIDPDWAHSWFTIELERALPAITRPIAVDGYTQPGSSPNTLASPDGLNTVLKIEIDGSNVDGDGFVLEADADLSLIQGLVINRMGGNGIFLDTTNFHRIYGNFIGTDVSGTLDLGNGGDGVYLQFAGVNRIGDGTPSSRNLISGNVGNGVRDRLSGSNVYQGNLIGVDRTTSSFLFNGGVGIFLDKDWFTTIGGTSPGEGNVIATSGIDAILLTDELYPGLGLPETSLLTLEPLLEPAQVALDARQQFFSTNSVGDAVALFLALFNLVAIAEMEGLTTTEFYAQGNMFLGNQIFVEQDTASILGIDLAGNGVTLNDPVDADGGPNNLRNYPVLTSATTSGATTAVAGTLNSVPNITFRIEFFASDELLASGHGPGERYLGFVETTTDALGNAAFSVVLPTVVPVGQFITSTATYLYDLDANASTPLVPLETSEISLGKQVTTSTPIVGDYNANGVVDAADYTVWRDTLGSTTDLRANGDDSNNVIDAADLHVWQSHFGNVQGTGSAAIDKSPLNAGFVSAASAPAIEISSADDRRLRRADGNDPRDDFQLSERPIDTAYSIRQADLLSCAVTRQFAQSVDAPDSFADRLLDDPRDDATGDNERLLLVDAVLAEW